jgi:hypothetical protein
MVSEAYPTVHGASLPVETLVYDLKAAMQIQLDVPADSIRQIDCIHVLQYVSGPRRVDVWNEWQRVLVPGGRVQVVVPHYSHVQSLAHPYSQWPPLSEFSFLFLNKAWRNASQSRAVEGLECDFEVQSAAIDVDAMYATRTQEWKDEAVRWFNNCAVQLTVWLVKR